MIRRLAVAFLVLVLVGGGVAVALRGRVDIERGVRRASRLVDTPKIGGQQAVIAEPRHRGKLAVVFLHGAGSDASTLFGTPLRAPVAVGLLNRGIAVAASDAHGEAWGNARAVADYQALIAELRRRGYSRLRILAGSMGGMAAKGLLNAGVHPERVAALFPVYDLRTVASYRASIVKAWGSVPSPVPVRGLSDVPLAVWASPKDTIVPKASNADRLVAEARADGDAVTEHTTEGNHGDPSNWQAGPLVAFLAG